MAKKLKDPNVLPPLTESQFLQQVLDLLALHGWKTLHLRPGLNRRGKWQTAVQGSGVGWPDVFTCKGNRLLAAELKVGNRQPTAEQTAWLDALEKAGVEMYVWRPDDWSIILATVTT
jgi:hypothetical protein